MSATLHYRGKSDLPEPGEYKFNLRSSGTPYQVHVSAAKAAVDASKLFGHLVDVNLKADLRQ